jgi:uncharacterized protein YjbJ (UPF0337 family)
MSSEGIRNTTEELAGKAKETVGDLIDNDSLEAQGSVEEAHAKSRQDVDDAAEDLKDASATEAELDDLKD